VQVSFRKVFLGSLIAATSQCPPPPRSRSASSTIAKLFEESPQAKVVQGALTSEFGPRYKALVAQEAGLKTKSDQLQKDVATMTPEQRTKAEKDLRDGARELERKKQEWQDDSNAKRNDEMNKLQRSLIGEVREYAKAQNFDIVIAEGVIYATPTVDITAAVLASLNARAPKPAAAAPAPTTTPAPAKPPAKP
jgi:outer membrane protein